MQKNKVITPNLDLRYLNDSSNFPVLLLGAGASKDIGMPICKDIFSREYITKLGTGLENSKTFRQYELSEIGFEELLSKKLEDNELEEFSVLLGYYEQLFLDSESWAGGAGLGESSENFFERFKYYIGIVTILDHWKKSGQNPVVISFNHDVFLECASDWRDFNYGSATNRMYSIENFIPQMPDFGDMYTLIKLHGSFNKICCDNCHAIMVSTDYNWGLRMKCMSCNEGNLSGLYIPPTKNKNYASLNDTWADACYFIERASSLWVMGYSMPSYDLSAKELLKKLPNETPLFVVDKYASDISKNYEYLNLGYKGYYSIGLRDYIYEIMKNGMSSDPFTKF